QHTCDVPVTCYRTVTDTRQQLCKSVSYEPVWTEHCHKVIVNEMKVERHFCPGPIVQRCRQLPGTWKFDPVTCTSQYCPGPVVKDQVQLPGHWFCTQVCVPHEEIRKTRSCHLVPHEHCHVVNYTVCKLLPYTVTRKVCYTTCRLIAEQHTKL